MPKIQTLTEDFLLSRAREGSWIYRQLCHGS